MNPLVAFFVVLCFPLAVDLLSLEYDGLWIRTSKYANGQARVYVSIGNIAVTALLLSASRDVPILSGRIHLASNVWCDAQLCRLEKMMEEVVYPPYIDRIVEKFFTKLSKPTAAQWRTCGEVLGPRGEASVALKLFAVIRYALQSSIFEAQVAQLRQHIDHFRSLVSKLHPFLPARVTNFCVKHIPDDILAHGPDIKMSGWNKVQEQVVALRALLRQCFAR
ncbi:hypothetical protein I309_00303 [Cryptococcus deuterogattii LA55]|nr:hypothetical protein I309_00303 [Cryptococcus deuterogattii LA55]KIR94958.1 hypothetical protein I304_01283 [Cryptococcus deuterogattii CBS 10090]